MSKSMSGSPAASQPGYIDPIDLLDFSSYGDSQSYQSPSLSPETTKAPFAPRPATTVSTPASMLSTSQPLTGPSHQYDQYKQQTGIVPGALATTFAVNQNNHDVSGYTGFDLEGYLGITSPDDLIDFGGGSQSSPNLGNEFGFFESTVDPTAIESIPSPVPTTTSNVGRIWPGMHQQAALAKARAQQRQQQQIIQQQQRQPAKPVQQRQKGPQPTDPIVEQKITQLLNSMRAKAGVDDEEGDSPMLNITRPKKDEEDMDEDERLLASEEGKKLSSKERRQLRNKVSARAFRSRRKEYITQLEAEIANKVNENGDLKAHNRALMEENRRLTDLSRMLLSSPSFSDFLDRLSSNPAQLPQPQPTPQVEQRETRQAPKDVNPYAAQQLQHQQIGMAMIPEQNMDFSMLSLDGDSAFNFQPQVYAVLETPVVPIDVSVLSGKTSNLVGPTFDSEDEKVEMPVIHRPADKEETTETTVTPAPADEDFENDPLFALYHDAAPPTAQAPEGPRELNTEAMSDVDLFGGVEPEKALARYELVDASEDEIREVEDQLVLARIQRATANLEVIAARLDMLSLDS